MDQLTVSELYKYCIKEIGKGNGNKHIVVADDNEGNGYHGLFYAFTPCTEEYQDEIDSLMDELDNDYRHITSEYHADEFSAEFMNVYMRHIPQLFN